MKKNDKILIGALLGITCILFLGLFLIRQNTVNGEAVVLVEGKEYGRYPLAKDAVIEISGLCGVNVLTILNGEAYMSEAVCPDKVCMDFGKIHYIYS